MGTRSDYEVLCVRVCRTGCPVSPDIAEFLSWQDVCALRAASPDVPLFIVLHMIMKRIRRHGENLEWVIVRKSGSHYYNISIRTRSVKRELKEGSTGAGTSARVAKCGERA